MVNSFMKTVLSDGDVEESDVSHAVLKLNEALRSLVGGAMWDGGVGGYVGSLAKLREAAKIMAIEECELLEGGVVRIVDNIVKLSHTDKIGDVETTDTVEINIKGNEILNDDVIDNELVGKDIFLHAVVVSAKLQEGMTRDEWVYEIHVPSIDLSFAGAKQEHFMTNPTDFVKMQRGRIHEEINTLAEKISKLREDLDDLY